MSYSGSIDLIGGLRPKNNGTFPLVNAHDVYVYDETRLDEFLENLPREEIPERIFTAIYGSSTKVELDEAYQAGKLLVLKKQNSSVEDFYQFLGTFIFQLNGTNEKGYRFWRVTKLTDLVTGLHVAYEECIFTTEWSQETAIYLAKESDLASYDAQILAINQAIAELRTNAEASVLDTFILDSGLLL